MRAKLGWGLVWGAILVSCFAGHSRRATAANCALYARSVTGVDLYGAAGGWWDEAAGRYQRGQAPSVGSILVFRRTGRIPSGHVAVVSKVMGPREILVDHANWYRGTVSHDMAVIDTSPNHDWTLVAVQDRGSGQLGADYPTYGFVYTQTGPSRMLATIDTSGFSPYVAASRAAYDPDQQAGLFHFAVADEYAHHGRRSRHWGHARNGRHAIRLAAAGHGHAASHSHPGASHTEHARAHHAKTRTAGTTLSHRA